MNTKQSQLLFFAWIIASIATAASLFFSIIMEFTPCTLCWYQRIAMYPLAIIFLIGFYNEDEKCFNYGLPFVAIGWIISLSHNLLQWGIIPESASPCVSGVPCTEKWINWFGFISIPFLAFLSFSIIAFILIINYRKQYAKNT